MTKSGISTITVQLPEDLAESLRREVLPPDKAIIEALEELLERRRQERAKEANKLERERVLGAIRSTGLWHSQEDQRAFVERLISTLGLEAIELPSHEELRQELEGVPPFIGTYHRRERRGTLPSLTFVAADNMLCKAAEKEKLTVENPNQH